MLYWAACVATCKALLSCPALTIETSDFEVGFCSSAFEVSAGDSEAFTHPGDSHACRFGSVAVVVLVNSSEKTVWYQGWGFGCFLGLVPHGCDWVVAAVPQRATGLAEAGSMESVASVAARTKAAAPP